MLTALSPPGDFRLCLSYLLPDTQLCQAHAWYSVSDWQVNTDGQVCSHMWSTYNTLGIVQCATHELTPLILTMAVLLYSPFYRWENRSSGRLSAFAKFTHPGNGKARFTTWQYSSRIHAVNYNSILWDGWVGRWICMWMDGWISG